MQPHFASFFSSKGILLPSTTMVAVIAGKTDHCAAVTVTQSYRTLLGGDGKAVSTMASATIKLKSTS